MYVYEFLYVEYYEKRGKEGRERERERGRMNVTNIVVYTHTIIHSLVDLLHNCSSRY